MFHTKPKPVVLRLIAAIAHWAVVSQFLLPNPWAVAGLLVPLAIWVFHKPGSPWLGFQGLQALAYQFLLTSILILSWKFSPGVYILLKMPVIPLCIIYGIYGGLRCLLFGSFQYILLGRILEQASGRYITRR